MHLDALMVERLVLKLVELSAWNSAVNLGESSAAMKAVRMDVKSAAWMADLKVDSSGVTKAAH